MPFCLLWFERGHSKKFVHGLLWIICLHLLRIVVFVLDIDISSFLLFIVIFVVEIIAGRVSECSPSYNAMNLTLPDQSLA